MACFKDYRKTWSPLIKTAMTTAASLSGDWFYYVSIRNSTDPVVKKYDIWLFIFFIVAATMSALTFVTLIIKGCCPGTKGKPSMFSCLAQKLNQVLVLEIFLADIPQFVLTSLISVAKGTLTSQAVFNIVTSAYNFLYDVLDICDPRDEEDEDENGNDDVESTKVQ